MEVIYDSDLNHSDLDNQHDHGNTFVDDFDEARDYL